MIFSKKQITTINDIIAGWYKRVLTSYFPAFTTISSNPFQPSAGQRVFIIQNNTLFRFPKASDIPGVEIVISCNASSNKTLTIESLYGDTLNSLSMDSFSFTMSRATRANRFISDGVSNYIWA